jgi:hypothetical protein
LFSGNFDALGDFDDFRGALKRATSAGDNNRQ